MKNKQVKQMICDVLFNSYENKHVWHNHIILSEHPDPYWNNEMGWFEFGYDMHNVEMPISLTAKQLKGIPDAN